MSYGYEIWLKLMSLGLRGEWLMEIWILFAEKGQFLGSPCDETCNPKLQNVYCDKNRGICECENLHPVRLGPKKGCAKRMKNWDIFDF